MGTFQKFHEARTATSDQYAEILMSLAFLSQNNLNESELSELSEASIAQGIATLFGKAETGVEKLGMKLHKGKGVIDYVKQFTGQGGKLLIAAIKKDKEAVAEISKTFDKAEFVDFLLKLDMLSMHILTGPIHMIDALTGWDLAANLKHHITKAEDTIETVLKSIEDLKMKVKKIADETVISPILDFFDSIEKALFGDGEAAIA